MIHLPERGRAVQDDPESSTSSTVLDRLTTMTDLLARLTSALADRYRIEHELGAGGMAISYQLPARSRYQGQISRAAALSREGTSGR